MTPATGGGSPMRVPRFGRVVDGEAALARDRYQGLSPEEQRQLRDFLATI